MTATNAELIAALTEVSQSLLAQRKVLNGLCRAEKAVEGSRQAILNKAASLVDDCAGALEELCFDLEDV